MNRKIALVVGFGAIMLYATVSVALPLISTFSQVELSAKKTLAGNIVGGTLSIGSLALAFLGYSLTQRRQHFGKKSSLVYSRVAMIMYLLIPLCVFDAITSATYLLTASSCVRGTCLWLFGLSILFLFVIGGLLIVATTYVVAREFQH